MKCSTLVRIFGANTFVIAAVASLALSMAPAAKADNKGCSNITLKGTFANLGTGFVISPPSLAGPLNGVITETFDGNGGVTSGGMNSFNGNISPGTAKGTYTVNPDCTGTYQVLITPGGFTAHYSFVIFDSGNSFKYICTDPGVVYSGVSTRQYPVGDWRQ
jgi:hypothetical protein